MEKLIAERQSIYLFYRYIIDFMALLNDPKHDTSYQLNDGDGC